MSLLATPVREHDGRRMRSLADALDKLRQHGALSDDDTAEIRAKPLALPDGRGVAFVAVILRGADQTTRVVHMPASRLSFTAVSTLGERLPYPTEALHEAISDARGNVRLTDGRLIHSIDLAPFPWPRPFTAREEAILRHAVAYLGKERECYGSPCQDILPHIKMLRYDQVRRLRVKPFAAVERHILGQMPDSSPGEIKAALKRAGARFPRTPARSRPPQ